MIERPHIRRELLPYVALVASLLATAATAWYVATRGAREDDLRFANAADSVVAAVTARIDAYAAMLLGGAGLFAASDEVTRGEFRAYVQRLEVQKRYPGIQGIGFSRIVGADQREEILASARRAHPAFRFWPPSAADTFTAILYLEPADRANVHALGFDMASEETRRIAMERARDTGLPAATGAVRLVQEQIRADPEQAGFLIYVPVYQGGVVPADVDARRGQLFGYVYSPFRADDLLQGILRPEVRELIGLEVFAGAVHEANLLHRARPDTDTSRFFAVRTPDVGGLEWTILIRGGIDVVEQRSRAVLALIAGGGTLLSLLLFLITRSQVAGRFAAERRAAELRESEEKLRAVDREKDAFLATISHELRTPLNAIVGWASILGRGTMSPETQAHAIDVIKRNAAAQTRLIEDLLDMSRAVAGHLNLHLGRVDARVVIEAAVDALRPAAEQSRLRLAVEIESKLGEIQADGGRLQQILMNLLSNAIKFTQPGGRVTLQASRDADALTIRISDTGIGIDPAFAPFLFDRFRQADSSSTRAHSGAGLGLAITRHLVQLHGGTIDASSGGRDAGATFTVRLPTSATPRRVRVTPLSGVPERSSA